jgi:4-alpha-glucanotransferase
VTRLVRPAGGGRAEVALGSELSSVRKLARRRGVGLSYTDGMGTRREASPEVLLAVLRALGEEIEGVGDAGPLLEREEPERPEPVLVAWDGVLPSGVRGSVTLEDGAAADPDGVLPPGYHTLERGGRETMVISAPRRLPPAPRRSLGVFAPVYSLRSGREWGAGDLTDLRDLAAWAGRLGCGFLGTLPVLASFLDEPFEASPYAPVSRLFWNEMYLDPGAAPEVEGSAEARRLMGSARLRDVLAELRDAELVDYERVMAAKRPVLEALSRAAWGNGARRSELERFARERPELEIFARWRAVADARRAPWQEWPRRLREGRLRETDADPATVRYHVYVQWLMEEQIGAVRAALSGGHQDSDRGLYLDLPVGVHRSGFDTWRFRESFAEGVSVGAPPDALFSGGQNWGFPPLHPGRSREDGHRYWALSLRHHLRFASLLRIDHVMGMYRLYWIPEGAAATEGVYVHYPLEELLAVLSVEAHRAMDGAGAAVVGENLGTVPPEMNEAMERHGMLRMFVGQFSFTGEASPRMQEPPADSLASLGTHDTPTAAGFLSGEDIGSRRELGLTDEDGEERESSERRALCDTLASGADEACGSERLRGVVAALLLDMARGPAAAVMLDLEDLWLERRPKNVPGIGPEGFPSWRRKMARDLGSIVRSRSYAALVRELVQARAGGHAPESTHTGSSGSGRRRGQARGARRERAKSGARR